MHPYRLYGNPPYHVTVLHGGPGAWGSLYPVAAHCGQIVGTVEPFLLQSTLEGQLQEVRGILLEHCTFPRILIGHSWGAWIAYLTAAEYPDLVDKCILIGSGPYEHGYYLQLEKNRQERMTFEDKSRLDDIFRQLSSANPSETESLLQDMSTICDKTDFFNRISESDEERILSNPNIFDFSKIVVNKATHFTKALHSVQNLRKSGELCERGKSIRCPVIVIHGDYDPHPAEGVQIPLEKTVANFSFFFLPKCGHYPWREKHAASNFYRILTDMLIDYSLENKVDV